MSAIKNIANLFGSKETIPQEAPIAQMGASVKEITLDDQGVTKATIQFDGRLFDTVKIQSDRIKPGDRISVVFYKG